MKKKILTKKNLIIVGIITLLLLILGVIIIYNKKVDVKKYNIDNKTEEIKNTEEEINSTNEIDELLKYIDNEINNRTNEDEIKVLNEYKEQIKNSQQDDLISIKEELTKYLESITKEENSEENVDKPNNNNIDKPNNNSNNTNKNPSVNNSNNSFKEQINSIKLNPIKTRYSYVDDKIGNIINSIIKNNMSNYEKLEAIYKYVINNMSYDSSNNLFDYTVYENEFGTLRYYINDGEIVYWTKQALTDKTGVCDTYASFFLALARRVGFNVYLVSGRVNGGGHTWNVLKIGDTNYYFDTQRDDRNGNIRYFGITESEMRKSYDSASILGFNSFMRLELLYANVTVDGKTVKKSDEDGPCSTSDIHLEKNLGDTINIKVTASGGTNSYRSTFSLRKPSGSDLSYFEYLEKYEPKDINLKLDEVGYYKIEGHIQDSAGNAAYYYIFITVSDNKPLTDFSLNLNGSVLSINPNGAIGGYNYHINVVDENHNYLSGGVYSGNPNYTKTEIDISSYCTNYNPCILQVVVYDNNNEVTKYIEYKK